MAQAHHSVLEVVSELPIHHRDHLFDKFYKKMPETRLVAPKLERLAELLGSTGVQPYNDMYLHKGGLLSWYAFPDVDQTTKSVERALRKEYPGVEEGLRPDLEWEADPVLYHMKRREDVLVLKFAALSNEREYYTNWKPKIIRYDEQYIIVLRDDPFTIEVRSAFGKVQDLYRAVSSEVGLRLDAGVECLLKQPSVQQKLKMALESRCFYAQHRHDDTEIARSSLHAQPEADLEKTRRLKQVDNTAGATGFTKWYDFEYEHEDDFVEKCVYKIKLSNGQIRVGEDTSEQAIQVLEEHVVALFTR